MRCYRRKLWVLCVGLAMFVAPPAFSATFNVKEYGAVGNGVVNDDSSIAMAISAAEKAGGGVVYFPPGNYLHRDIIKVGTGIKINGAGAASILTSAVPEKAALFFDSALNCGVANLQLASRASKRLQLQSSADLVLNQSKNCKIEAVLIRGSASAGILIADSQNITVSGSNIQNTLADGVHVVNGSSNIVVKGNVAVNTGDDSFSAVSYANFPKVTSDVKFENNETHDSRARGITCIGANNCSLIGNKIFNAKGHGVAVAYEKGYATNNPKNAILENNQIETERPTSGTNSLLIDGANGVKIDNLKLIGGNPVLISGSTGITFHSVTMSNFSKTPIVIRGGDAPQITGISLNGVPLGAGAKLFNRVAP